MPIVPMRPFQRHRASHHLVPPRDHRPEVRSVLLEPLHHLPPDRLRPFPPRREPSPHLVDLSADPCDIRDGQRGEVLSASPTSLHPHRPSKLLPALRRRQESAERRAHRLSGQHRPDLPTQLRNPGNPHVAGRPGPHERLRPSLHPTEPSGHLQVGKAPREPSRVESGGVDPLERQADPDPLEVVEGAPLRGQSARPLSEEGEGGSGQEPLSEGFVIDEDHGADRREEVPVVLPLGHLRVDLGGGLPKRGAEVPQKQGRCAEPAAELPEEPNDLGLALRLELFGPEGGAGPRLPSPEGDRRTDHNRAVDLDDPWAERGDPGREALFTEHPPSDEELGGEAGDGALGDRKTPAVLEDGGDPLLGKVEAEAEEPDGDHEVVTEDAIGRREGRAEGGAPVPLGVPRGASEGGDGQSARPVEREDRGGVGPDRFEGRVADGTGRGREEGGSSQRRSASFFSARSKRMPTAWRAPGGISSPISWTVWTT